jgi:hypothetical protein
VKLPKPRKAEIRETEAGFQKAVLALAKLRGWKSFHARKSGTGQGWRTAVGGDGVGFPDLVLVRDRVLFCELKTNTGQMRREQRAWLAALNAAGATAVTWRPRDWKAIEQELA